NAAVANHLLASPLQEGITFRRACPAGPITANEVRANVKLRCMIKYDKSGPLPMLGGGLEVLSGDSGPKNSAGWPARFPISDGAGAWFRQWRTMRNCLGAPNRLIWP